MPPATITDLTPARQRLVAMMQDLRYGQIRNLRIEAGEPVFDPAPQLVRTVQLGGPERAHRSDGPAFRLKPHVIRLMDELSAMRAGTIPVIKIQDGLPVHAQLPVERLPTA